MGEKYKRIYRKRGIVHLTSKVLPQSSMMYNWIELPKRTNLYREHQVHRRKSNEQQKIRIISHYSTYVQKKSGKRTKDKMEDKANKWKRGQAIGACSLRGRADWSNDRYALLMLYNYSDGTTIQSLIRKIASSMLSFCSLSLLRQIKIRKWSYECQHSTPIFQFLHGSE